MSQPFKILFKYPCRGRERLFFESLDSVYNNLADKNNFLMSLTLDEDDEILNQPKVVERISEYPNSEIRWGRSESKIHAVNRGMPDYDFDIIVCWSNDMFATIFGFDDLIRQYTNAAFWDMDGLIHFPEPDAKDALNVLYIATRKYYDRFGYIYHPSYKSLWCDNESMDVAKMLGRYHYCGIPGLFVHKNPAYAHHGMERDAKFNADQDLWAVDEKNYWERKAKNFDL